MKKVMLLMAGFLAFGATAFAQDEDDGRWLNEFSFGGEIVARTQVNMDGTAYAGLDNSELNFTYKFTEYSGVAYNMIVGANWHGLFGGQWDGTGIGGDTPVVETDSLYAYTDILGEIGANSAIGLGFKIGIMSDGSEYLVGAHALDFGFNTGDGMQHDDLNDALNIRWDIPINALSEVYPLTIWIIHDADFTRSNNDFNISVHLESAGFTIADMLALDWNAYYNYQGGAEVQEVLNADDKAGAGSMAIESHTVGFTLGASLGMGDNMRIGLGFAVDYNKLGHAKEYSGAGVHWWGRNLEDTARAMGIDHLGRLSFNIGMRFTMDDMVRFNVAYRGAVKVNGVVIDDPVTGLGSDRHDAYYDDSSIAFRVDLLMLSQWVEIYGGMSFDLRTNSQMKDWYGDDNRNVYFSDRLGVDVGAVYTGWSNMRIYAGYFWGNLHNGGIENTDKTEVGDTTTGGRRTNKIGNHMYIKAKFYF